MRILAIEKQESVRKLYTRWLSKHGYRIEVIDSIGLQEVEASKYDVVIVDSESVKYQILNVPYNHLIVASDCPTALPNGSWAISKPFHMEELSEILDIITGMELNSAFSKEGN